MITAACFIYWVSIAIVAVELCYGIFGKDVGGRNEIDILGFLTWKWWNIVIVLSFDEEHEIVYSQTYYYFCLQHCNIMNGFCEI